MGGRTDGYCERFEKKIQAIFVTQSVMAFLGFGFLSNCRKSMTALVRLRCSWYVWRHTLSINTLGSTLYVVLMISECHCHKPDFQKKLKKNNVTIFKRVRYVCVVCGRMTVAQPLRTVAVRFHPPLPMQTFATLCPSNSLFLSLVPLSEQTLLIGTIFRILLITQNAGCTF